MSSPIYFLKKDIPPYLMKYFKPASCGKCYICKLLKITAELKRILKPTGVLFWNHGDCYGGSGGSGGDYNKGGLREGQPKVGRIGTGVQRKCLALQNWRLVLRMVDEQGWILRNSLVWFKPNNLPSSIKDRFTNAYEMVFMLVKNRKYWFDLDAVRIPWKQVSIERCKYPVGLLGDPIKRSPLLSEKRVLLNPTPRKNPGDVWDIATCPSPKEVRGKHFATFPEKLIEPMIKVGCPEEVCTKCGKPKERIVVSLYKGTTIGSRPKIGEILPKASQLQDIASGLPFGYIGKTIGWSIPCNCGVKFEPGIVLDPFMGSGTVGVVAKRLGRNFIGIELNPEYVEVANERLKKIPETLF